MTVERSPDMDGILRFWTLALRLKKVRRQGWIDRGIAEPESSADHSWGVALLAWLLARGRDDLDSDRVVILALVHDLPEALAGDVTPFDDIRRDEGALSDDHFRQAPPSSSASRQAKYQAEKAALETMAAVLDTDTAVHLRACWHEYEAGETPEARFVKQVDKLETLLQAEDYRASQPGLVIDSFRIGATHAVSDAALVRLIALSNEGLPEE